MKKVLLPLMLCLFFTTNVLSQKVNKTDISNETDLFELYIFKKPFSNKESYFVDFGQDKFRPHYYDHKTQAICNDSGKKFEKGTYIKLAKFLKSKGWAKTDERESSIGEVKGRVLTFEKKVK